MDEIIFADKQLTLFLNGFHSAAADFFFYTFTSTKVWIPLFLTLLWMVMRRQGGRGLMTVVVVALLVLISDQLTSGLFKVLFERFRPSYDETMKYMVHVVNDYYGAPYGFVSSHAANTFAIATFFALVLRNGWLNFSLFTWATVNCYGRIYEGLHFVGDIVCGAVIGIILARIAYEVYLNVALHFFVISHHNKWTLKSGLAQMFGKSEPSVVVYTFWLTIVMIFIMMNRFSHYHGAAF